jgi:hypothetical protein
MSQAIEKPRRPAAGNSERKRRSMNIIPTIGRVMWFHRSGIEGVCMDAGQPMAAIVAFVHSEKCVNLTVFDHLGGNFPMGGVRVRQDGDPDDSRPYVAWMPYQVGQAKKELHQQDPERWAGQPNSLGGISNG